MRWRCCLSLSGTLNSEQKRIKTAKVSILVTGIGIWIVTGILYRLLTPRARWPVGKIVDNLEYLIWSIGFCMNGAKLEEGRACFDVCHVNAECL